MPDPKDTIPGINPPIDPMQALQKARSIGPTRPTEKPQGPLEADDAIGKVVQGMLGFVGLGNDDSQANRFGQVVGAGIPILKGVAASIPLTRMLTHPPGGYLHTLDDIKNIANGEGIIPLFHGTSMDNAMSIMNEGMKLHESGEEAAQHVAKTYGIPWSEWKHRVEPDIQGAGYGTETAKLSTAPYGIAKRWADNFPQGEIRSELNSKARLYSEAKKRGMPYDDMYNMAGDKAVAQGTPSMYKYGDAVGAEDRMAQQNPGGAIIKLHVDGRAIPNRSKHEAQMMLRGIERGEYTPEQALQFWNSTYQDIKIHPQHIQKMEILPQGHENANVSPRPTR
jgi:hypothetical protein